MLIRLNILNEMPSAINCILMIFYQNPIKIKRSKQQLILRKTFHQYYGRNKEKSSLRVINNAEFFKEFDRCEIFFIFEEHLVLLTL